MALLQSLTIAAGFFIFQGVLYMEYVQKKHCTIKERKQAARILAAREGLQKVNDAIINKVGSMSDDEIIKFLDNELERDAAPVEVLQPGSVEEIKPAEDPEKIYTILSNTARAYMNNNNWDGEKITPLQWGAVCLYVGIHCRSLFRGVPINENTNKGIKEVNCIDGINAAAVAGAVPVWLSFCYEFNKPPLICNFMDFVGVSKEWLYMDGCGVTSERMQLKKNLEAIQADGLRQRVINPKESPIGPIFLLKADHGLVEASKVTVEHVKTDASGAALPVFGADPVQIDENGLK